MTTTADGALRRWPATLLRFTLWLTATVGLMFLAGALSLQLEPRQEENHDLPDPRPIAVVGLTSVGLVGTVFGGLGLAALQRPRPVTAKLFLLCSALLPVVSLMIMMTDVREEASASEMGWFVLAWPSWFWAIELLAASAAGTRALRLEPSWGRAARWSTLAIVGSLLTAIGLCNLGGNPRAAAATAALRPGSTWYEVVRSAGAICPMSRADVPGGVMWLSCEPSAPSACWGAPAVARGIELRFDEAGRLASWREHWQLCGLDRESR